MLGRSILAGGLGVLLFASTTVAQPGGFPGGGFPGGPGGPGGGGAFEMPKPGQILTNFLQEQLKLKDEQKKQVGELQKNVDTKLDKMFTDDQKKQWKEMKDNPGRGGRGPGGGGPGGGGPGGGGPGGGGPGGAPMRFGGFPLPGQIMAGPVQDQLKLTDEQKKQVDELQKEVDTALDKTFSDDQKKMWKEIKDNVGRAFGGPGGRGPGGPGGPGGGGFGGPGGFGGGGFGVNRLDEVKKQLGATDEEWKVISPKIQKVISARQVLTSEGGGGFGGGFGGPTGSGITQAQADLKATLDDPKHTDKDVEEKIAAVRKARQKVRDELAATQKDLQEMLTKTQTAVLLSLGYLE